MKCRYKFIYILVGIISGTCSLICCFEKLFHGYCYGNEDVPSFHFIKNLINKSVLPHYLDNVLWLPLVLFASSTQADDHISSLEMQFDLQTKIVEATRSLAQDKSTSKHVRKQRRKFYNCAVKKVTRCHLLLSITGPTYLDDL